MAIDKINIEDIKFYFEIDKKDGRIVLLKEIGKSYTQNFKVEDILQILK